MQFFGGALIVGGVVMVRADELRAPAVQGEGMILDSAPEALPAVDLATGALPIAERPA